MPITRQQFELGIDDIVKRVMEQLARYLSEHRDQAYSREELGLFLGFVDPNLGDQFGVDKAMAYLGLAGVKDNRDSYWDKLAAALDHLVASKVVQEREIGGVFYYAIGDRPFAESLSGSADIQPEKES